MEFRLAIINVVLPCIALVLLGFVPASQFVLPEYVFIALILFTLGRAFLLLQQQTVFSVLPMLLLTLPSSFNLEFDIAAPFALPMFLLYLWVVNLQWGQRPWLHPLHLLNLMLLAIFLGFAHRLFELPESWLAYADFDWFWFNLFFALSPLVFVSYWHRIGRWSSYWPLLADLSLSLEWGSVDHLILWASAAALFSLTLDSYVMAFVDELTGILGRRALEFKLKTQGKHYYVAMVDVDHFKKFNDTYGHQVGDDVLKIIAKMISRTPGATAYRYGGEEFCLVFSKSAQQDVMAALEHTRKVIEEYALYPKSIKRKKNKRGELVNSKPLFITASFGVAQQGGSDVYERVIERADKALYKAKQNGRNRVSIAK